MMLIFILCLKMAFAQGANFSDLSHKTYRKYANALTFHITRSPQELNWDETPKHLLWSLIKNKYFHKDVTHRAMGHVTVEINCTIDGKKVARMGGQGARNLNQFSKHLAGGAGFNVILSPQHKEKYSQLSSLPYFNIEGRFETPEELEVEYNRYLKQKDLFGLITYTVSEEICSKLITYFDDYKKVTQETENAQVKKAANVYGNGADPLKFEGAGCAPFAVAFLKLANLEDQIPLMTEKIYVEPNLFSTSTKKVSLLDLLLSSQKLKEKTDNTLELEFPSPSKLYHSINTLYKSDRVLEKGLLEGTEIKYIVVEGKK
jgi:hypothetical protein